MTKGLSTKDAIKARAALTGAVSEPGMADDVEHVLAWIRASAPVVAPYKLTGAHVLTAALQRVPIALGDDDQIVAIVLPADEHGLMAALGYVASTTQP